MKKIMEMLQNMKAKNEKKDNKGFSLVELIIVIAIMAILVGIVGTQVLPYINKSKEAKDLQIINSYGTAATTAYSSNAEKVTDNVTVDVYTDKTSSDAVKKALAKEIIALTGYDTIDKLTDKMGSKDGKKITKIVIVFDIKDVAADPTAGTAAKTSTKTIKTQAYAGTEKVFDEVVTQL